MRVTRINNFFNFKRKYKAKMKTYHFDRARYELILLKKLDDNKIFYNGIIYEKDFLYYHKLEDFVKKIYALRDEYILKHFQILSRKKLKELKKHSQKYNFMNHELIPSSKPFKIFKSIDEILKEGSSSKVFKSVDEILKEGNTFNKYEINILINAFRYTFNYPLDYDLLDPYTRRRPIYKTDSIETCNILDPDVRERKILKNEYKPYTYVMFRPNYYESPNFYQFSKNPILINSFFEDWFYIIGWRSIKRVHPIFELQTYPLYTDGLKRKNYDKLHNKEQEEPVFRTSVFTMDQGSKITDEWIVEYDEKKKFDEYDIHCKTNSYYTRYKRYNEFYHEFYPENKKFKTTLVHDFTEDEINANYANMIDKEKKAIDKWNYVVKDGKYHDAVRDFFTRLERHQDIRKRYEYPSRWYLDAEEDSNDLLGDEIDQEIFQLLNDPQYILVLPLVDAYFEIFRPKGWYNEDESFLLYYPTERKILKHLEFFDISHERQYWFAEKRISNDDYLECDWDEFVEEHTDDEYMSLFRIYFLFIWLTSITLYMIILKHGILELPIYVKHVNENIVRSYEYYFNKGTRRAYYGFELRKARMRYHSYKASRKYRIRWREWRLRVVHKIYNFPARFYNGSNYTFYKQRTWKDNALDLMLRFSNYINDADYGLQSLDLKLRHIGYDYQIYRFRIYYVEHSMPRELQLFIPKIVDWWCAKVYAFVEWAKSVRMKYWLRENAIRRKKSFYLKYHRHGSGPNAPYKRYLGRQDLINWVGKEKAEKVFHNIKIRRLKRTPELRMHFKKYVSRSFFMTKYRREKARLAIVDILGEKDANILFKRTKHYFGRFEMYQRRRDVFEHKWDRWHWRRYREKRR